jgi:hypothetical protein
MTKSLMLIYSFFFVLSSSFYLQKHTEIMICSSKLLFFCCCHQKNTEIKLFLFSCFTRLPVKEKGGKKRRIKLVILLAMHFLFTLEDKKKVCEGWS